jgi:hypothetical protein
VAAYDGATCFISLGTISPPEASKQTVSHEFSVKNQSALFTELPDLGNLCLTAMVKNELAAAIAGITDRGLGLAGAVTTAVAAPFL